MGSAQVRKRVFIGRGRLLSSWFPNLNGTSRMSILPRRLYAAALSLWLPALACATDWSAAARQDLQFAADTIRARHAGVALGQPSVTVPLDTGYRIGMADAAAVSSEQDYLRLMSRFFAGFGDPHTAIGLRLRTQAWTGLALDLVDGRYRVVWSEPGWPSALPPVGAIAQQCDDAWIGTYLQVQVAPFVNEGAEYAGGFSTLARRVMFDTGLGWMPKQCVFTLPDGSRRRYALAPRGVPDQVPRERVDAVAATLDGFALAEVDLELRGEGDVLGAAQAGARSSLKLLRVVKDSGLIVRARELAEGILSDDPDLRANPGLRSAIERRVSDDDRAALAKN